MNWMVRWAGALSRCSWRKAPARISGTSTGIDYLDLCLGDTGAMTGHAPAAAVEAVAAQARRGMTFMLPTEDAVWLGEELARRFGLPYWQATLTATDANRFAIRLARHLTGRPKILVFHWCYHGTVDETFVDTARRQSRGSARQPRASGRSRARRRASSSSTTCAALEAALAEGDVACVLAEPVMTNIGIVQPEPGFHAALREITRRTGTLLILDETHTICGRARRLHRAPGDCRRTCSRSANRSPAACPRRCTACRPNSRAASRPAIAIDESDTGGIGGTLAGNALSLAAMRATLESVLTDEAYAKTIPLARRFAEGVAGVIAEHGLPWHVQQLGCRAEYWFRPTPPRNGSEAAAAIDPELDRYMHLAALNRGILMTPFHNMALVSPATTEADIDLHTRVFRESVEALAG